MTTRKVDVNELIPARQVRAVFPGGTSGIMPTAAALVPIAPTAAPPVAEAIARKI